MFSTTPRPLTRILSSRNLTGLIQFSPFWVEASNGTGYVELPYTLPQDSTLFLVLGEKTNDVWKRKLDWVAKHGGLALVNVHPDYVAFDGRTSRSEFPAALYEDFLAYVKTHFGDTAWFALPRDAASFVKQSLFPIAGSPKITQALVEARQ